MVMHMEPTKGRFRGEEVDLADAPMMLTKAELEQVEVTREDGTVVRPWRFNEVDPKVGSDDDGILSF